MPRGKPRFNEDQKEALRDAMNGRGEEPSEDHSGGEEVVEIAVLAAGRLRAQLHQRAGV